MDSIRNAMKKVIEKCDVCIDGNVISKELLIRTFSDFISSTIEDKQEVFHHSIVKTISFAAHALPDAFFMKHSLILFVLVLPALIRVKNKVCSIRNLFKRLVQHGCYHAQHRTIREGIAD